MREVEGVAHEEEVGQHDGEVDAVHGEANERDAVYRLVQEGAVQQGNKERADQHQMNHGVALPTPSVTLVSLDGHVGRVQTAIHR